MSEVDFDPERPVSDALNDGIRLFNDGEFEESHEDFEHGWLASEAGDSDFFKGLVQAAICLHKLEQGQRDGAKKLHTGMRRYLAAYLPSHRGVDVSALLAEMSAFLNDSSDPIDWARAPQMQRQE
jgi:hypothetical protein